MIKICITFDYELFFGKAFYPEKDILIDSTDKIIGLLDKYQLNATFFADIPSIMKYRQVGKLEYPDLADLQLLKIYRKGNDVQLHIHPNWYTAEYESDWKFKDENYRIHSFGFDRESGIAETIIKENLNYLNNLIQTVDKKYRCIAYRAGGYCIQPERELFKVLIEQGIRIDSSICKNICRDTGIHYYSFFNLPEKNNWWIDPEKGIGAEGAKDKEEMIFEVPIGSYSKKPWKWCLKKCYPRISALPLKGEGTPVFVNLSRPQILKERIKNAWKNSDMLCFDDLNFEAVKKIIQYYVKRNRMVGRDEYIAIIGHPKFLNDSIYKNMESCFKYIKNHNQIEVITMQGIYDDLYGRRN